MAEGDKLVEIWENQTYDSVSTQGSENNLTLPTASSEKNEQLQLREKDPVNLEVSYLTN